MERIVQNLEKVMDLNIYRKGGLTLKELHYNDNERIQQLVLVGNEGVVLVNNKTKASFRSSKYLLAVQMYLAYRDSEDLLKRIILDNFAYFYIQTYVVGTDTH